MATTSKYKQTFYQAEADALFPAGCKCGNNGGGDCDWCRVYYNGPEYEGYTVTKRTVLVFEGEEHELENC